MEANLRMRKHIFEAIDNQIKANDPPETKTTFDRLRKEGFSDFETRQLIGQCVAVEIFRVMKHGEPFDEARYLKNLSNLPKEPFD